MNNSLYKQLYVSKKEPLVIEYTQGSNLLPIEFEIMDWTIPTSSTAQIYIEKPSGALIFNAATVSGQNIIVQPTTQMTAEIGANKGQLMIVNGDKILQSFVFILKVFESIIDDSAIESTDEFTALEEALSTVSDVVTHTELQGKGSAVQPVYFDENGVAQVTTNSFDEYEPIDNVKSKGSINNAVYFDSDGVAQVIPYVIKGAVYPNIERTVVVSSLPTTVNVSAMTSYYQLINARVTPGNRQLSDLDVTTADGSFTITGTISGQVSIELEFAFFGVII